MAESQMAMFDMPEGERRRDAALDQVADALARKDWIMRARDIALEIAREQGTVDADRLLMRIKVPEGWDHRIIGAVFRTGKHSPFVLHGMSHTARKQGHKRPMSVWRLKRERHL